MGIASFWLISDGPDSASFLTAAEKTCIQQRKMRDQGETLNGQQFHWKDVKATFTDWKVYGLYAKYRVFAIVYSSPPLVSSLAQSVNLEWA